MKLLERFKQEFTLPTTENKYGIFVTIENNKRLRGCIGQFTLTNNIGELIAKQTLESAFIDSRFFNNMITKNELSKLSYKINFIGQPKQIYPEENKLVYDVIINKLKLDYME